MVAEEYAALLRSPAVEEELPAPSAPPADFIAARPGAPAAPPEASVRAAGAETCKRWLLKTFKREVKEGQSH